MKIDVSNLRPNPFRNLKRLPLKPEKVDALVHSIRDTSFWDNLIGRKVGDTVEVAYGHHRIAALKKAKVTSIEIIVRPLTDTEMVKIMSHENMGEWTHDAEFETETVRATLEAAAAGKIDLPKVNGKYAGNNARVLTSAQGEVKYSAATLAEFLGWRPHKVEAALANIGAIEAGVVAEEDLQHLSSKQAEVLVTQAKRAAKQTTPEVARKIASDLAGGMRKGSGGRYKPSDEGKRAVTIHNIRERTDELIGKAVPKAKPAKPLPDLDSFISQTITWVTASLQGKNRDALKAIAAHREHANPSALARMVKALRHHAQEIEQFADMLEGKSVGHNQRRLTH